MAEGKRRRSILEWVTPLGGFRRARDSVVEAHGAVKEALARQQQTRERELDPDDLRRIEDERERFIAMYKLHGWTEHELREQQRAVRNTKITALALTAVAFVGAMGAIWMAPGWMLLFVLPVGGSVTILCAAQAFRYALWEAQLEERAFIDAKTFLAMPNFWQRLLG